MSKYEYLDKLSSTITDPEKLRLLLNIPENVLAIAASEFRIDEEDGKKLNRYPIARIARVINFNRLIDFSSPEHKRWQKIEENFCNNQDFISFSDLTRNDPLLSKAKTEIPSGGTLSCLDELGIEEIGIIPKKQNQVDILVKHNQYREYPHPGFSHRTSIDPFDCKKYKIPLAVTIGELKKYDPNRSVLQSLASDLATMRGERRKNKEQVQDISNFFFYFAMPLLNVSIDYCEVALSINKTVRPQE